MDQIMIGDRVSYWRKRRGQSQTALAGLAGINHSYLSKIENGVRPVERRATLVALAEALQVSVSELTGRPGDPTDPARARAAASIPAIREALIMRAVGQTRPPSKPATVDQLLVTSAAADYAASATILPDLLASTTGAELVQVCYAAMSFCTYVGYGDLGREAARLALATAEELDDPRWIAVAGWAHAQALPPETAGLAVTLARQAAERVQPYIGRDTAARQAYGMLHLIAALRAAIAGMPADAVSHLDEAEAEAATLGDPGADGGLCRLGFGPTNVAIWRSTVLSEIGDVEQSAAVARRVEPGRLPIPNRQAMFWVDYGRTLATLNRDDEAVAAFLRAETVCPQLVRLLPTVQSTIGAIWRRKRRAAITPQLRRAAEMVGIRDH